MTRESFLRVPLLLLALSLPISALQAQTVSLFSTGVDAAGAPMAGGASDSHYLWLGDSSPARVLTDQAPGPYVQSPTSRWVWTSADGLQTGIQRFMTTFTLTATEINAGVTLSGRWATDNRGLISLNETPISGSDSTDFASWTAFITSSNFVVGVNALVFEVNNDAGFGGLNVDQLQYTVGSAAAAPEPGTLALLALGGMGLVRHLRRRS